LIFSLYTKQEAHRTTVRFLSFCRELSPFARRPTAVTKNLGIFRQKPEKLRLSTFFSRSLRV